MKTRVMLFGVSILLMALSQMGGWSQAKYVPKENEELYGTWTNDQTTDIKKIVVFAGGWKDYKKVSDTVPFWEGTEQIESKWTDAEGDIWYKTRCTFTSENNRGKKFQELHKLSKSATVKESQRVLVPDFDSIYYPTKVDPRYSDYSIYYRAEK